MTDPNGAAILMVCHGSHQQKNPINVSINIAAPFGSVMGMKFYENLGQSMDNQGRSIP